MSHYLNTMSLRLMYDVIDGEQSPRLVYEPILPGYSYPADVDEIVPDQHIADERIENGRPCRRFRTRTKSIYMLCWASPLICRKSVKRTLEKKWEARGAKALRRSGKI